MGDGCAKHNIAVGFRRQACRGTPRHSHSFHLIGWYRQVGSNLLGWFVPSQTLKGRRADHAGVRPSGKLDFGNELGFDPGPVLLPTRRVLAAEWALVGGKCL